ncbi:MAG: alpha/beta hydrolase [Prevotella sp.]|nr:alpha/beta hydrolase [Candidatus Equicola stercoris]
MRKLYFLLLMLVCMSADAADKQTFSFVERDGKQLFLDHYTADSIQGLRPCVIFVFGGGFAVGKRDSKGYLPYFEYLCKNGIDVVSIDYRLAFSHAYDDYGWKKSKKGLVEKFKTSVQWAAEDLLAATAFVLDNAESWSVDTSRVVVCGSSAGAITCLQAENMICNADKATEILPSGFNYAGVISFAGAIFSTKGKPKWQHHPCPVMMFHGNSDNNVPYRKASLFGIGFYGSALITEQLKEMGASYYFYSAQYRDHRMALEPMWQNRGEIMEFLREAVFEKRTLQIEKTVTDLSKPKTKTKFSLKDYLSHDYAS